MNLLQRNCSPMQCLRKTPAQLHHLPHAKQAQHGLEQDVGSKPRPAVNLTLGPTYLHDWLECFIVGQQVSESSAPRHSISQGLGGLRAPMVQLLE
jgi:hypothetical protein